MNICSESSFRCYLVLTGAPAKHDVEARAWRLTANPKRVWLGLLLLSQHVCVLFRHSSDKVTKLEGTVEHYKKKLEDMGLLRRQVGTHILALQSL